ncbi:MAG: type II toxin-antitoxin system Phd/YefM family antitoxin [Rubrivivax sp.]|nr:type II toxin-antitoxin system Phd/YefM family antitoxin [Rubrivivax sp.]
MPVTVNVHEAKTQLSRLLEQAAQGREVVIAKAGRPVARLVPVQPPPATRALGFLAGRGCAEAQLKRDFAADIDSMFAR